MATGRHRKTGGKHRAKGLGWVYSNSRHAGALGLKPLRRPRRARTTAAGGREFRGITGRYRGRAIGSITFPHVKSHRLGKMPKF
jgi:hypothetical protein